LGKQNAEFLPLTSYVNVANRRTTAPDFVITVLSPGSKPFFKDNNVIRETLNNFTVITEAEIDRFVEYYRQAALNASGAGFDSVELHGANKYVSADTESRFRSRTTLTLTVTYFVEQPVGTLLTATSCEYHEYQIGFSPTATTGRTSTVVAFRTISVSIHSCKCYQ
jgi:hypothetical protein